MLTQSPQTIQRSGLGLGEIGMDVKEAVISALNHGVELMLAAIVGGLATLIGKPSRKEFDELKLEVVALKNNQNSFIVEMTAIRTAQAQLIKTVDDGFREMRRDLRDWRNERRHETND